MESASTASFASHAGNAEDVVVWRALGHLGDGRYAVSASVATGSAADAAGPSPVRALGLRGWEQVEPGHPGVHLLVLGPAEPVPAVAGDPPWVLLTARAPQAGSARSLPGFVHCLYDGVNDFYASEGHPELVAALSCPACSRDGHTTPAERVLSERLAAAEAEAEAWRARALAGWQTAAEPAARSLVRQQLSRVRRVAGVRVVGPLRTRRARARAGRWV